MGWARPTFHPRFPKLCPPSHLRFFGLVDGPRFFFPHNRPWPPPVPLPGGRECPLENFWEFPLGPLRPDGPKPPRPSFSLAPISGRSPESSEKKKWPPDFPRVGQVFGPLHKAQVNPGFQPTPAKTTKPPGPFSLRATIQTEATASTISRPNFGGPPRLVPVGSHGLRRSHEERPPPPFSRPRKAFWNQSPAAQNPAPPLPLAPPPLGNLEKILPLKAQPPQKPRAKESPPQAKAPFPKQFAGSQTSRPPNQAPGPLPFRPAKTSLPQGPPSSDSAKAGKESPNGG